jgi:hypothetical protein
VSNERRSGLRPAKFLRSIAVAILCLTIVAPTTALAQGKGVEVKPEDEKGYTLPYFFTLVGFLAIVLPVCMTAGRKWDFAMTVAEE